MKSGAGKTNQKHKAGYSLVTVMVIAGISMALFASMARLTSSNSIVNDRNNTYNRALAAAEGASETVLGYLARDFQNQAYDPANVNYYSHLLPTSPWSAGYLFGDTFGVTNKVYLSSTPTMVMTNLNSQFAGLYGLVYNCTVRSSAQPLGTRYNMIAAVEQDVQLASIPVFQFAIFYGMDLEVNPGAAMKVTGKVHSNADLYTAPGSVLEYCDDVTVVGRIYNNRKPGDPAGGSRFTPVFDAEHLEGTSSLTLAIGTNRSPEAIRTILQVPPFGEPVASQIGQERYYNKSDLIVTVTDTSVAVQCGYWNGFTPVPPDVAATSNTPPMYSFIRTNASFFDQREGKITLTTDLDVAGLGNWMTNAGASLNSFAVYQMGQQLNSVYVNDLRLVAGKLTVARVVNGRQLPPSGLTVATPQPLYVLGHFNAPIITPGSTDTSGTKPASLLGDAITVLSANWTDANSASPLGSRNAVDTTVNAALLSGIVPTTTVNGVGHYSGGVENFTRLLESWSGKTFTYNGSMAGMFPSQYATHFWVDTGTYYTPPVRKWSFDLNFLDYRKLPPATPEVRKLVRGQWTVVSAR